MSKKTNIENLVISDVIEKLLNIKFTNQEFSLNNWGDADNWCKISDGTIILLECEKTQKHPCTNILKLYPFLEENKTTKIILLHYFFPQNKAPKNRVNLCQFLSQKLEIEFSNRFIYTKLEGDVINYKNELQTIKEIILNSKSF